MASDSKQRRLARNAPGIDHRRSARGVRKDSKRRRAGLDRCGNVRAAQRSRQCTREEIQDQVRNRGREVMRALHLVVIALLALISNAALAHEMTMAEMEVRETAPSEFL